MIAPWIVFALTVVGPTHVEVIDVYRELDRCQEDAQHVHDFYQDLGKLDVKITCEAIRNHVIALPHHAKN